MTGSTPNKTPPDLLGYYAISHSSSRVDRLVILFSFFEVSPARFHAYLHALLRVS